ncbi:bacteriocin [uncultured Aquimarina sp.]|uniref:bacteriocin n=1 Tax=uncultured Aquimarina sp. TaxID=575652 RepID=UPI0026176031|nr:bacteriocin [uncultured Aquimarina sp.]
MENLNSFKGLSEKELIEINGGGLVEDIGYAAHAVVDGVCTAANWVAEKAEAAYDEVMSWFD